MVVAAIANVFCFFIYAFFLLCLSILLVFGGSVQGPLLFGDKAGSDAADEGDLAEGSAANGVLAATRAGARATPGAWRMTRTGRRREPQTG